LFFEILIPALFFFLSTYVGFLVAISLHEFGHVFAALTLGYEVDVINLGVQSWPTLEISFKRRLEKICISPYPFAGDMGLKQNKRTMTSFQRFVFLTAGPLSNILIAIILFLFFAKKPTLPPIRFWDCMLYSVLFLNLFIGLFNLTPLPLKDGADGNLAWEVITGKYAKRIALKSRS